MGKLGGNELNYSSDVDLLYVFGDGEAPVDAEISNREYFIRLAQSVTEILSRPTNEGAVFRIDLRLRPQGHEGEPAVSIKSALRYYAEVAHDWELQALIKVRHSAGDQALAREFIRSVQPRVYTQHINFAAIETAFKSLEKIGARRKKAAVQAGASTSNSTAEGSAISNSWCNACSASMAGRKNGCVPVGRCSRCRSCTTNAI